MFFQYVMCFLPATLISCSLYKKEFVSDFSSLASKQVNTLIHCGAICNAENDCTSFSYKEKYCELFSKASLVNQGIFEPTDSHKAVYIDTASIKEKSEYDNSVLM